LIFLGLSVLDLSPLYATDRRQTASLVLGVGHNNYYMWLAMDLARTIGRCMSCTPDGDRCTRGRPRKHDT